MNYDQLQEYLWENEIASDRERILMLHSINIRMCVIYLIWSKNFTKLSQRENLILFKIDICLIALQVMCNNYNKIH